MSAEEVRDLALFEAGYESDTHLRVDASGSGEEMQWILSPRRSRRRNSRRLDGATLKQLESLYGAIENLSFIGAFDCQRLAGLVTWKYEAWNRLVWLCDIRVREEQQRRGIGAALVRELQWAATRCDARGIMLETQTTNYPAIHFYLKHGFELVGVNTALYSNRLQDPPEAALFFLFPLE